MREEEREYERDGEVKMLRSELRKRDDQLREMHMRLVSEQKAKLAIRMRGTVYWWAGPDVLYTTRGRLPSC